MKRITKLKILIIGMRGLGIEVAKNIILQGAEKVSIYDSSIAMTEDLGTNFYLDEKDIGKKRRDEAVLEKLQKLNDYVTVNFFSSYNKS